MMARNMTSREYAALVLPRKAGKFRRVVKPYPMIWAYTVANFSGAEQRLCVGMPIRVVSEANGRDHWRVKSKRVRGQRLAVAHYLPALKPDWRYPVRVTLHRLGIRELDNDNLAGAFKAVKDAVAEWLGMDDADKRVEWSWSQTTGREYGIVVTIEGAQAR